MNFYIKKEVDEILQTSNFTLNKTPLLIRRLTCEPKSEENQKSIARRMQFVEG
jgi:hypothetical protein